MAILFKKSFISQLQNNNNKAERVQIKHHVRNIDFDKFLKEIDMNDVKDSEDEYSFRCQNILMKTTTSFLDYMWNPADNKMFVKKTTKNGRVISNYDETNSTNFYLSRNAGEATIIFTSLTKKQQSDFVKVADIWGKSYNIKFFAINGDETSNACAEIMANSIIKTNADYHCVFVTANMAARSFSVPKIANGIMMVNEPGYGPAVQKYNRLATIDWDKVIDGKNTKVGHMYWFNFKSLKLVCPLVNILYIDLKEKKKQNDIYGKPVKTMIDAIDIFSQDGETQAENAKKWTENDIFNEINKGIVKHDFIANHLRNCVPELEEIISEIRQTIDLDKLKLKNIVLGKTIQQNHCGGKSNKTIKSKKKEAENEETNKKKKVKISDLEIATTMVAMALGHEVTDRNFRNFCGDCKYMFTLEGIRQIGEENIQKVWNIIDSQIRNLKWKVENVIL